MNNITKGIRGAITVDENSSIELEEATKELLKNLIKKNEINKKKISHVIFTLTPDINADFPAKFARENFAWNDVAMICTPEIETHLGLKKCLRVLIVVNCDESFKPLHCYLKGAKNLRPDL